MSQRLLSFMAANRITQASVARAIDLDPASLNRSLRGSRPFTLREVTGILFFLTDQVGRPVPFEEVFAPEDEHATAEATPETSDAQ